jgi:hypothetical protein
MLKTRDIVVGFVFLVVLITGIMILFRIKKTNKSQTPLPTPNIVEQIKSVFPNIPEGIERANLKDVSGGSFVGVATKTEVVANLPELSNGEYYKVSLVDPSGKIIVLGNMVLSKSGYILKYDASKYPGYNKVIISGKSTTLLEGSF